MPAEYIARLLPIALGRGHTEEVLAEARDDMLRAVAPAMGWKMPAKQARVQVQTRRRYDTPSGDGPQPRPPSEWSEEERALPIVYPKQQPERS